MAFINVNAPSTLKTSSFHGTFSKCTTSRNTIHSWKRRTKVLKSNNDSIKNCATTESKKTTTEEDVLNMSESDRKQKLLDVLSEIQDPDLHQNIVSLGFIKDIQFESVTGLNTIYDVSFKVELTTPACPIKETFRNDCKKLAESISWIGKANIEMTAMSPGESSSTTTTSNVFEYVNSIVAVASCKGGVGKSTTAVNLAFSLASTGARIGILDADIYGPSLPTLVQPKDAAIQFKDGKIKPLIYNNVKLMSFGFINPDVAVMRGPMIASMLNQIATTTEWGVLDYLIIDMPPGTGDIQITLSQILKIDASIIVTTPQKLCFVDVIKGIDMFNKVNIPSIAVVENMSYFEIPNSNEKYYLFGNTHTDKLKNHYGILNSFQIPIEQKLGELSDSGKPYVDEIEDSKVSLVYKKLSECVVREVAKIKFGGLSVPNIIYDEEDHVIRINDKQTIQPKTLREQCRCALCVEEMTGKILLDFDSVPSSIYPKSMRAVGNYALEVIWSDGHPSLYPYSRFVDDWDAPTNTRLEQIDVEK